MNDKYLRSEVTRAAEHLCKVLRNYSEGKMSISVRVFSRDETELDTVEFDESKKKFGLPDYYSIRISTRDDDNSDTQLIGKASLVFYSEDEFGCQSIRKTLSVFGDGEEEDE